ncbi:MULTISPECIES: GyrI-like domain-containing protein [Metabacillus]|jgi:AraC family transcriptional regulator|uniref:AraC family transcriptional regulator n=2 Tax=Metabacillus TaxID=2675233 RepID=A0A179SMD7_9BACI|nr:MULTISPECIES: GyrI-like domain-containing protein [Metabacillus]OAS82534.1 AraC family transcriptional regulator [Metabacillus litoralis]QNF26720.1 AraC family transcriptional regulator [Metabacillus sp. KUDC1714]
MNYKIIQEEAFVIIGKGFRVSMENGENNKKIPLLWKESNQNGFSEALAKQAGDLGLLGVCLDFNHQENEFTYFIGAEKTTEHFLPDWELRKIPAATWAVFESIGPMPDTIQQVWKNIYSEWFPSTGYEHANGPEFESYSEGDPNSEDYRAEVWIPIIKK